MVSPVFRAIKRSGLARAKIAGQVTAARAARRRMRTLTVSGLPAVLTAGGVIPILIHGTYAGPAPAPSYQPPAVGYYNPATGIFNLRNTLRHGRPAVSFRFGPHAWSR